MPRPRTPPARARATGADRKNPGRHAGRGSSAKLTDLGAAPTWLDAYGKKAFALFKAELPYLKESHRVLVELASKLRGRMIDPNGEIGLQAMQELRRCLAQLGATPADESRVTIPDDGDQEKEDDPFRAPTVSLPKPH